METNLNSNINVNLNEKSNTLALLALAISSFCIGTTEFVVVGLLPSVSRDLNISITLA